MSGNPAPNVAFLGLSATQVLDTLQRNGHELATDTEAKTRVYLQGGVPGCLLHESHQTYTSAEDKF